VGCFLSSERVVKAVKLLGCLFLKDVLCSFRVSEQMAVMDRCLSCVHYKRFMEMMEEEDREIDAEMEFIHAYGYEAFDREFKKERKG